MVVDQIACTRDRGPVHRRWRSSRVVGLGARGAVLVITRFRYKLSEDCERLSSDTATDRVVSQNRRLEDVHKTASAWPDDRGNIAERGALLQETRSFFTIVSQLEHFNWLVVYG